MPSSYQVVLWKQESFVVLRPLQIEFFRSLLEKRRKSLKTRYRANRLFSCFVVTGIPVMLTCLRQLAFLKTCLTLAGA
jgi:hypothetical protein